MNSNPALGLIGFWMLLQLAATLAILVGGIYALYCLGRAAAGLDRLASAMEEWVAQQAASTPALPGAAPPLAQRLAASAAPEASPNPVQAQPFSPVAPSERSSPGEHRASSIGHPESSIQHPEDESNS